MVVQRSPPPVRRSPRKEVAASDASFTSFSSQTSQARKTGKVANSTPSAASRAEPATPLQHAAASDFPSLDQMAAVSKEQRSASRPNNRAVFTASFPTTSFNTVPSSLPRPTAQVHRIHLDSDSDDYQRPRAARSSLTNGAIQRVRQQAGDETPLGVSQARAARQAATTAAAAASSSPPSSSKANSSLLADDSGDSTAQLVPGRRDPALNPINADIDVENPQMPSLTQPTASTSASRLSEHLTTNTAAPTTESAADASTASQASIFGTANRRNGRDQPIGAAAAAAAGTAYDFSKYLDGELDPFNRASRTNPRRESRPLPVQQTPPDDDNDDAETSGDTTARGGLAVPSQTAPKIAPVESTPLVSRVKALSAATPRMSPHASPSVPSRKLVHLSSLSNGHTTPIVNNTAQSAAADVSTASLTNRYDPAARTDRLQNMELGELRKKHTALARELAMVQDALASAKEESEGWASECNGLQEQLTLLKGTHQAAIAREDRARVELQVRLSQYKIEADDRAWKLLAQRRQTSLIDAALQHAKNEATYHEGRYHATESELEGQKDELRIRLMIERKRADLLALHVKAALRDGARLKKRLSAKSAALLELQSENEKLAEQLEDARHSRRTTLNAVDEEEKAALRHQLEEAQAEIETLNERDAMMAETRKTWKAERKQLLAQVEELSANSAPAKSQPPMEASRPVKTSIKPLASQMLPPSSPVYAKKKRPMQGASELGPPSEDEVERRIISTSATARKGHVAKTTLPLVPFAQISTKTAPAKKVAKPAKSGSASSKTKSSKNWRDEVAITDSSEEDSDDDRRQRNRNHRAAESDSQAESEAGRKTKSNKTKSSSSTTKRALTKSSTAARTKTSKLKPAMPIEYDDQTADPSATPIIRSSNKRTVHDDDSDNDQGGLDSSVLGAKFGRDRTNLALNVKTAATRVKSGKVVAEAVGDGQVQKKKKRKLLGAVGGAMQWGGVGGDGGGDVAGLAPNFDIPLELSPIKGGGGSRGGVTTGLLTGFGLPSRNPFV
ncbi:uncharacterized protein UTRI_01620 [Ustilago trichophora]|uniref:Uncharacterized protein n=1 Tax=Ustilago trichophora TaxID=86804 RepID=A0A5C3DXM2_9BASI|nr:uncharacterized protein UTRI_01620 [Ustilago trichophora]